MDHSVNTPPAAQASFTSCGQFATRLIGLLEQALALVSRISTRLHHGIGRLGMVFASVLLLGMAPMAWLLWHVAETGRADQTREAQVRLLQAARFASALQTDAIASIGNTLATVVEMPMGWALDDAGCVARVRRIADQHPYIAGLAVLRADGTVLCSQAGAGRGVNLADRDYVRLALRRPGLAVGRPVVARISGMVVLPMALSLAGPARGDHSQPTLLAATLDLAHIARMLAGSQNLRGDAAGGRVKILDTDGRMLVDYPPTGARLVHDHPLNTALMSAQEGVLDMPGHDGLQRLFGFAHASEGDTVYAVTVLAASVTGPADARFRTVAALALLAALTGLALAFQLARFRILRPMAVLTQAATRAQGGAPAALPTRRLPQEFEVLRQAMASMLAAVQHREANLEQANRDLVRLAARDALTGIANRRAFDGALAEAFAQAQSAAETVALLIFDVDFFKKFNDRYGHLQGDECLRKVAATIAAMPLREADLAARLGGEEFVLLLPDTDTDGAVAVAERTIEAIRDRRMLHEDGPIGVVTASCGVASCRPIPGMDAAALIAAADAALYRAKAMGRDRVATARDVASAGVVGEIEAGMQA
jgi:diguanylate cyclase (GGDEF)-like protein